MRVDYLQVRTVMAHSGLLSPVEDSNRAPEQDIKTKDEVEEAPVLNDRPALASRQRRQGLSRKAELSAYMAIAASAFGLISDGCEPQRRFFALSKDVYITVCLQIITMS